MPCGHLQRCAEKSDYLLSTRLAWPAWAGCKWAELFSRPGTNFFAQPCTFHLFKCKVKFCKTAANPITIKLFFECMATVAKTRLTEPVNARFRYFSENCASYCAKFNSQHHLRSSLQTLELKQRPVQIETIIKPLRAGRNDTATRASLVGQDKARTIVYRAEYYIYYR